MNNPFDFTNLKLRPFARRKRPWLGAAALAGGTSGAIVGFLYAACILAMSGLALPDGEPVSVSFGQEFLSFLRIIGLGAGLGAALFLAVAAFGIAICNVIKSDQKGKSIGLRLTRLGVVLVLLVMFAVMISTVLRQSLR
jgi:hypothetical protein